MKKSEFEIVKEFSLILGLQNQTDGSLFIYKNKNNIGMSKKPDGYYYLDGVTFILDAKSEGQHFTGQLEDYMKQESNPNFIGFKYNGINFECYVKGKLVINEKDIKTASYYLDKYFSNKLTNPEIVEANAEKLANMFRNSGINKQYNVPFIGCVMLCLKFKKDISLNISTNELINSLKLSIESIIEDEPRTKKEKKDFLKNIFNDDSIKRAKLKDLISIISVISNVYNFINVSEKTGQDTMNSFLRIFRKWNSADSQEKGEVFTPDHISQIMIELIDLKYNDILLDPTCGSGTFLTNGMHKMIAQTSDDNEILDIKQSRIIGIELDSFNATLAGINMLLHGDGSSQIYKEDCFKKLPHIKNNYNKVLMNPPFSIRIPELTFVYETLNNCREGGVVASILPLTVIKDICKHDIIKKHRLLKVVKLNRQLFLPNAAVWTGIVVFKAHCPHDVFNDDIKIYNYENDGYELLRGKNGRYKTSDSNFDINDYENAKINENLFLHKKYIGNIDFICKLREYYGSLFINKITDTIDIKINREIEPLNNEKWKSFKVTDLFYIETGKEKNSKDEEYGVPFIAAKKVNEGIAGFKINSNKIFNCDSNNPLLAVVCQGDGGSGKTYTKIYNFSAVSSIKILKPKIKINENIANFISQSAEIEWFGKYGHGNTIDLYNEVIRLPQDEFGNLDLEFMDSYINQIIKK